jgi:hypothetical protein
MSLRLLFALSSAAMATARHRDRNLTATVVLQHDGGHFSNTSIIISDLVGASSGNRSDHINPTHYGSPLDSANSDPPINCRIDEDGLILDSFIYVPSTGKMTQVAFMWCSPNTTRTTGGKCPTDAPPGATTKGAIPMTMGKGQPTSCFLSCTKDSDCGPSGHPAGKYKAVCAPEMNRTVNGTVMPGALPANMCSWKL